MFKYIKALSSCKNGFLTNSHTGRLTNIPSFEFSKKFYEKRTKIKNYLSKEKEQYRNSLLSRRRNTEEDESDPSDLRRKYVELLIENRENGKLEESNINQEESSKSSIASKTLKGFKVKKKKERMNKIVKNSINYE
jgi:hypothetical protein